MSNAGRPLALSGGGGSAPNGFGVGGLPCIHAPLCARSGGQGVVLGKPLSLAWGPGWPIALPNASATLQRKVFGVLGRAPCYLCFCAAPVAEYHVKMQVNTKSAQLKLIHPGLGLRSVLENEVAPEVERVGHLGLGWLFVAPTPIRRLCRFLP